MTTISDKDRAEAQVLAETFAGSTLNALPDDGIRRWLTIRDSLLTSHTCESAWRPTTFKEIQPGWMIRARHKTGYETTWGIAHHLGVGGDWYTEKNIALTHEEARWTYETTAPMPEPDPDPRIAVVMEWYGSTTADPDGIADLLARLDKLKEGEQP